MKSTSLQSKLPSVQASKVQRSGFFSVREDLLKLADQSDYTYYSLELRPIAVMVLATTPDGLFVLNHEYRHPTGEILLSCPGGLMDEGEKIVACAERELAEETGYKAENFKHIGTSYPFPGITGQQTCFVVAEKAIKAGPTQLDRAECLETKLYSKKEIDDCIVAGVPVDGLLLTALYFSGVSR